ncbi:Mg chelatase, subunit ChlI [Denitrovibrio acetiphilus DSM 12809]|uniref:Mg chelatase, subunit ChlI n=1 Tax=Denitrovibrio acetiphilus (strain DSM 12809 / NBRC 114555 / N2460) TaxID=522772 RepID=D4H6M1_DENA2|nr:YifB family Mg chelatase-like AAA ATPase [Denitrovibrio acetiphilus]ADD69695.1 Mg chelatase, subunit ChlI [Denitrovibrio acetiphilus DSM 12809]
MFSKVFSAHVNGIDAELVEVETDIGSMGLPSFSMVGLADAAVRESRDRVRAALKNININVFAKPITINLAPADFKKDGTYFDLPVAVGLALSGGCLTGSAQDVLFAGELSLDGRLRGVNGILSITLCAKGAGFKKIAVPKQNADEAAIVSGIEVYPFETLDNVLHFINEPDSYTPHKVDIKELFKKNSFYKENFAEVKGQLVARRCAEIAAAGMHNLLMIGAPGSGKTMIARRLPGIMPDMSLDEAIETTKIHSVAGLVRNSKDLKSTRPFFAPHHTSSNVALIGGTSKATPGQVSLATNGVLFLDEFLEFSRGVLETLRQPLEDGEVTIARAARTVTYPAKFMLAAAANPCPCGYLGDKNKECTCTQSQIQKYRSRLSGPLMDRIDLHVEVHSVDIKDLSSMSDGESSENIRERVKKAHEIQNARSGVFNSRLTEKELKKHCKLDAQGQKIIETAAKKYSLSARAYSKLLKTSRTIADLEDAADIQPKHLLESLQYRMLTD